MRDERIHEHPVLEFERGKKVRIIYDGRELEAFENETIASALYANGYKIFSRSLKFHRPRGMYCGIGKCSSCMMRVNGVPNVRTCIEMVSEGQIIESQNSFPSARFDVFNIFDYVFPKKMDYHHIFLKPKILNRFFQRVVRYFSGIGEFPQAQSSEKPKKIVRKTDIAIVGGGPGGLSAAIKASKFGASVTLIDENPTLGGQLIKQTHRFFGSAKHYAGIRGTEIAKILVDEVSKNRVKILLNARVFGCYPQKLLGILQNGNLIKLKAKKIIFATGAYENHLLFENNDLPGVYGAGGAQTLMNVYGVKPGDEALIVGSGNVGLILAYQLLQSGVRVKAIVEALPKIGGYVVHAAKIKRFGVPILTSHTVKKALGRERVKGALLIRLTPACEFIEGTEMKVRCDFICLSVGLKPTHELLYQAGCNLKLIPELGGFVPLRDENMQTSVFGVYVVGDSAGIEEASSAMMEGKVAGISAALSMGIENKEAFEERRELKSELGELRSAPFSERIRVGVSKVVLEGGK
ncbi:MAG: FAD-dependent oxidoreductase [Candidatus Methanofastidiosia archaeon]